MKLVTHPSIINSVFFLQLVDNALADITEGSDIVGKYFEVDHDLLPLPLRSIRTKVLHVKRRIAGEFIASGE
jgi:hypothetical protein